MTFRARCHLIACVDADRVHYHVDELKPDPANRRWQRRSKFRQTAVSIRAFTLPVTVTTPPWNLQVLRSDWPNFAGTSTWFEVQGRKGTNETIAGTRYGNSVGNLRGFVETIPDIDQMVRAASGGTTNCS